MEEAFDGSPEKDRVQMRDQELLDFDLEAVGVEPGGDKTGDLTPARASGDERGVD